MQYTKRDFTYKLNDEYITIDMQVVKFDTDEESYLILFKPYLVMVYNSSPSMITHVSFNMTTEQEKWVDNITKREIDPMFVDPKIRNRLYAEILLD